MQCTSSPESEQLRNQVVPEPVKNGPDKGLDCREGQQDHDDPMDRPNFLRKKVMIFSAVNNREW